MKASSLGARPARRLTRRRLGLALVLSSLGFVCGCMHYEPMPLSAATQAVALESRTLADQRLDSFIRAIGGSPNSSADPSWDLAKLTLAALYYHPDLEIARSKLELARASVVTAAQIPNPTASASLMFSPLAISPAIDFLVETFGRREYRTAQAEALDDAARQDVATAAWQVRGKVRTALLNMWAAERRSDFLQRRSSLQDQLVQLLERRFAEGEASSLDVTRERINRNQLSVAVQDNERRAADARAQLAVAVGVPVQALDGVTFSFQALDDVPPIGDLSALRRQALASRTDVQALLAQYRAAESAVQLEIAKQYPNVDFSPGYTYEPGTGGYEFSFTTAAEVPLFNRNQGPIAQAESQRRGIAAQLVSLQAQTIGGIDSASTGYRSATLAVETADALVAESRRRNDQVSRSFEAGESDRPTLVSAEIELAIAELSRFEASVLQRQALGALEDSLQSEIFEPEGKFPANDPLLTRESVP
jgi:cobalt-zinc-cadmium efflux system outer membrane protein